MFKTIFCLLLICFSFIDKSNGQNLESSNQRLRVYIDCFKGCDMTFIRTEINIVDFMLDRLDADIHILINDQNTGGGGDKYQIIFLGKKQFSNFNDTISFVNNANNTDFEERNLVIKHIKIGLIPFLSKNRSVDDIVISLKENEKNRKPDKNLQGNKIIDPWKYWIFRIGVNGNFNLDEVYKSSNFNGNFSANRITEEMKMGFSSNIGRSNTIYNLIDSIGNSEKVTNKNNNYSLNQYYVKSLGNHLSFGFETGLSRSTFTNNKNRYIFETGIEYNFFPYQEVNTRLFTFAYSLDVRHNIYYETTLYDKIKETLWGHSVEAKVSLNQKWGTVSFGADYHNYFHNWKYFNLGLDGDVELRVSGGLSCFIYSSAELTRDQIFLQKEGATQQEILTRQRQLASGYEIRTRFGINYRFGSKLNNFVNPRFEF